MRFKIRSLLLAAITVAIIPPLLIIAFFYNTSIRELYQNRSQSYGNEIIRQAGENINTLLGQAWFTEKRLTSNVRTSQILLEYSGQLQKLDIINDIERMIWNYKQSASYISDIYLFSHDNRLFSTTTTTNLASLKQAPWVTVLDRPMEQGLVSATHKAYYDVPTTILAKSQQEKYVISFVRKVYHLGLQDKYSILQMDLKYAEIEKIMDSIDLGVHGFALIVNEDGLVIYCDEKAYLGRPLEQYMASREAALAANIIETEHRLDEVGWRILGYVSTEAISQEFSSMNSAFIMAMAFSLFAAGTLSIVLSSQVTKPVATLTRQMRQVGSGNFTIQTQETVCEEMDLLNRHFQRMVNEIDDLMYMVQEQEQEKASLEFQALQNQINPHFMYNTLNTIKWMALMQDSREIADAIVSLVKMLRFTYSDPGSMIAVRDSIAFLKDYTTIQQLRYGDGIHMEFCIDPALESMEMLKFILQPIVENAFIHGFPEDRRDKTILLRGELIDGDIVFTVKDNGIGMEENKADRYSGLGIKNVQRRIQLHFGKGYGLRVESRPGVGTEVTIRIPAVPWTEENGEREEG